MKYADVLEADRGRARACRGRGRTEGALRVRDPFEDVERPRPHGRCCSRLLAAVLLLAYGLVFPTQVAIVAVVLDALAHHHAARAGHFFTAKRTGMKVTEFFVGFGPAALVVHSAARPSTASRRSRSAATAASSA